MSLQFHDFRPIRDGDLGWSAQKQKARWYYSPSTKESIPLRQFQKGARGGLQYNQYVKERQKQGIEPKKYVTKKTSSIPQNQRSPPKPKKKQNTKPRSQAKKQPKKKVKRQRQQQSRQKSKQQKTTSQNKPEQIVISKSIPKKKIQPNIQKYRDRRDFLQEKYTEKYNIDSGLNLQWKELSDNEKAEFWRRYHELVDRSGITPKEYNDADFNDYFGDYDEIDSIEYGTTP